MKVHYLIIATLMTVLLDVLPAYAFRTLFDLGSFEASINSETVEGKAYDIKISEYFNAEYSKIMQRCFLETRSPVYDNFKIVLEISATGKVTEIESRPKTNIATCLMKELENENFPKPSKEHYWVEIDMAISK